MKLKITALFFLTLSSSFCAFAEVVIHGNNTQQVEVSGVVANVGTGSSEMNIGSIKGRQVLQSNDQRVSVKGAVINHSLAGGKAYTNIGSVSDRSPALSSNNRQRVSIRGSVVNSSASGMSEINIR